MQTTRAQIKPVSTIKMNCKANIAITMKDENQVEQLYEDEAYDEDVNEKVNYGDVGKSFVIRRILLNEIKEDIQKHCIFKTMFTCQRKVCNVIIDSNNIENLVSQYMVDKFQLKTMKHHLLIPFDGLRKKIKKRVTQQCLVPISNFL